MTEPGVVTVKRVGGQPHITRADRFIEVSRDLVDQIRSFPSAWSWADDEASITIQDASATYTYRIVRTRR